MVRKELPWRAPGWSFQKPGRSYGSRRDAPMASTRWSHALMLLSVHLTQTAWCSGRPVTSDGPHAATEAQAVSILAAASNDTAILRRSDGVHTTFGSSWTQRSLGGHMAGLQGRYVEISRANQRNRFRVWKELVS
jgi:hypothetical protein